MLNKKATKAPKSNPAVFYGSSHYNQQTYGSMKKTGCGCGKKKMVVRD
jgi:hypothetical protein